MPPPTARSNRFPLCFCGWTSVRAAGRAGFAQHVLGCQGPRALLSDGVSLVARVPVLHVNDVAVDFVRDSAKNTLPVWIQKAAPTTPTALAMQVESDGQPGCDIQATILFRSKVLRHLLPLLQRASVVAHLQQTQRELTRPAEPVLKASGNSDDRQNKRGDCTSQHIGVLARQLTGDNSQRPAAQRLPQHGGNVLLDNVQGARPRVHELQDRSRTSGARRRFPPLPAHPEHPSHQILQRTHNASQQLHPPPRLHVEAETQRLRRTLPSCSDVRVRVVELELLVSLLRFTNCSYKHDESTNKKNMKQEQNNNENAQMKGHREQSTGTAREHNQRNVGKQLATSSATTTIATPNATTTAARQQPLQHPQQQLCNKNAEKNTETNA